MDGYKHYIRIDNGVVVKGFTDAFEQPETGDLLLTGQDGRHFTFQLMTERLQYKYKVVDGQLAERSQTELDAEWNNRPPAPPSTEQKVHDLQTAAQTIDERTLGMQFIDDFTLQQLGVTDERTNGMKEIDDYTLELVFAQQAVIEDLQRRIQQLEGA